ncbi:hypothetical protein PoB_002324500 [Plakobranchus ocellatus]|uniref:Uncharacterized protein n=1 Tax=Plakobranchus ocellatus TaxID=259542 RepID=A0AAV3ZM39_9GAST|nr:hypothetical protein PoB_002324500 [Plakobranchus ocellatus]
MGLIHSIDLPFLYDTRLRNSAKHKEVFSHANHYGWPLAHYIPTPGQYGTATMAGHRPTAFLHLVNLEQPLWLATDPLHSYTWSTWNSHYGWPLAHYIPTPGQYGTATMAGH